MILKFRLKFCVLYCISLFIYHTDPCGCFSACVLIHVNPPSIMQTGGRPCCLLLELYNYGTMSFYWGRYEERENEPAFESRMNASAYLKAHGKIVKGHPLCWHTVCADWLLQYDNKTILDRQLARIDRDVRAFAGAAPAICPCAPHRTHLSFSHSSAESRQRNMITRRFWTDSLQG